jgi:acetyl-CoA synthetase
MSDSRSYPVPDTLSATSLINKERYEEMYQQSIESPNTFWAHQAREFLDWIEPWHTVTSSDFRQGEARWFEGAKLNACVNCVDRHLAKRGAQTAIIWEGDSPADSQNIS